MVNEAVMQDKELTVTWNGEADSILVLVRFLVTLSTPSTTETFIEDRLILCYSHSHHN